MRVPDAQHLQALIVAIVAILDAGGMTVGGEAIERTHPRDIFNEPCVGYRMPSPERLCEYPPGSGVSNS